MGKIIEFIKPEYKREAEGIQLYYRYYKTLDGSEIEWTLQMIATNIGCNSFYDRTLMQGMEPQDALELIGYAAAKRVLKTTKATANYYKKLSELIEKYGLEVIKNAKKN